MKYLKVFENFSDDDIISTIKDLCLDLTDEGFNLYLSSSGRFFILYKNLDYFTFNEVLDTLLNIRDYIGDKWVSCGVVFVGDPTRIFIDINWEDYDRLDQMFDTDETPIVDLVVNFNI